MVGRAEVLLPGWEGAVASGVEFETRAVLKTHICQSVVGILTTKGIVTSLSSMSYLHLRVGMQTDRDNERADCFNK